MADDRLMGGDPRQVRIARSEMADDDGPRQVKITRSELADDDGPRQVRIARSEMADDDGSGSDLRSEMAGRYTGPDLTVTQAAKATGVDRRTISRRLDAHAFPNAHRDVGKQGQPEAGPWLIPVSDLDAAGLRPYAPTPVAEAEPKADDSDLRVALADALRRAEVAEAVAAERDRTIEALRGHVRAIEAGPVRTPTEPVSVPSMPPTRRRGRSRS